MVVLLYTRRGCHLCERAEDLLAGRIAGLELRDVDGHAAWRDRYGLRVPVLEVDGVVAIEGRFDEAVVAGLLARLSQAQFEPPA